jgi:predicted ArsR family transcriptional regulator
MSPRLTERQLALLEALRDSGGESNDFHLAFELGTPRNAVRGMLSRLEDKGLVETSESRSRMPCSGGETFVNARLVEDAEESSSSDLAAAQL